MLNLAKHLHYRIKARVIVNYKHVSNHSRQSFKQVQSLLPDRGFIISHLSKHFLVKVNCFLTSFYFENIVC